MRQAAMRPLVVVVSREGVQEGPELGQVCGLGLGGEPFLEGLLESFDLALVWGVVRAVVLLLHAESRTESRCRCRCHRPAGNG